MKRSILLLAVLPSVFLSSAQSHGFLSGTAQYVTQNEDDGNHTLRQGTFGPAIGFNLGGPNVIGLAVTITTANEKQTITEPFGGSYMATVKQSLYQFTPFYRYMKSVGDKFSIYGQLKFGVGFGTTSLTYSGSKQPDTKVSMMTGGIGPGLVFVPATHWALSADWGLLGYTSQIDRTDANGSIAATKTKSDRTELGLNPGALTLALNWLF